VSTRAPEIDQAAFDEWFASADGERVLRTAGHVLFQEPPDVQRQFDFLANALRIAFRNGFVAGRSNIRPNGGTVLERQPAPGLPF
jgi:hypothetical protein